MRYVAMQLLTWGTIAGAAGSAWLLAALDSPLESQLVALPQAGLLALPTEATAAGQPGRAGLGQPSVVPQPDPTRAMRP